MRKELILTLAALGPFALFGGEVWAERAPRGPRGYAHPGLQGRAPQVHAAADHEAPGASTDGAVHYLTINVDITDSGIEPASVFIPMGQRVQLVLRNRGTLEHHYRVVGLVPGELRWASGPNEVGQGAVSDGGDHPHHAADFTAWRATSPAGIGLAGDEVHAYAPPGSGMDVVHFTATNAGTFVVQCPGHGKTLGKVTVFDSSGEAPTPHSATGAGPQPHALTRSLGVLDYPTVSGVKAEAIYATPEYVRQAFGPAGVHELEPDRYLTILMTERLHVGELPTDVAPPELQISDRPLPLVDRRIIADSPHHRVTAYRFTRKAGPAQGHQVMSFSLASGQRAIWHLPILGLDGGAAAAAGAGLGLGGHWGLILALLGGMLAAMWPCLFQLTVYFIPALAGVATQDGGGPTTLGHRSRVLRAASFFILGFTVVYTMAGAIIGFGAQQFGDTAGFEVWQRYLGIGAGAIVIVLALRIAARMRAPLVCRMPVLSGMARADKPANPMEMMLAGLAFATGCMTCFGSALVVAMVVYVGMGQSALYGALVLFIFSLGMAVPLVIAAIAMARVLPLLFRLERLVPWMGLVSAIVMMSFGALLMTGNYMVISEWTQRLVAGSASLTGVADAYIPLGAIAGTMALVGALGWLGWEGRRRANDPQPGS